MTFKSFTQMEQDFDNYYVNVVKPYIPEYENLKKQEMKVFKYFKIMWFSFLLAFLSFWAAIFSNILKFSTLIPIIVIFGIIFIILFIVGLINIITLTKNTSANKNGQIEIEYDFDAKIKEHLMNSFLKIFSDNAKWQKGVPKKYESLIKYFKSCNIFNTFPMALIDDVLSINYKNVEINIYDLNTSIFKNTVLSMLIPFFLVMFICFSLMLYFIPVLILIIYSIINIRKIMAYSGFKGVVIELKMNKNFKGHTFFLENTLKSKKMLFNRKNYEIVKLESTEFNKKYNVYTTDQIESRYLLTTAMIERIKNLTFMFSADSIRGSFKDDKLILAINTGKDMFEMGSDFSETNFKLFEVLFNEIISVLDIVNQLKLNENTGL